MRRTLDPAFFPSPCTQGEGQGGGSSVFVGHSEEEEPLTLTLSPSTGRGNNANTLQNHRTLCFKLWRAESLLLAFLATLVIGNFFIPADRAVHRNMLGHDFTAFYAGGHFAALGQFDKLYDIQAIKDFEQATGRAAGLTLGDSYGPFWNPPFYAWIFAPLSKLPFEEALAIWTLINITCLLAAIALMCRMLGSSSPKHWALIPLLLLSSMPLLQALSHGQNTCTSLLLLTATVICWRSKRGVLAGVIGGLLFYKPQLGAIVTAVMVLDLGITPLIGLAISGVTLTAITVLTMPGALQAFLHQLPANLRFMQIEHPYVWERHATLKAFWRLLFQGRGAAETLPIVTALYAIGGAILALALFKKIRHHQRDRLIAATIVTMPLLMPFYFDYDLLLLAIPATLFAAERLTTLKGDTLTFSFPAQAGRPGTVTTKASIHKGGRATQWTLRLWITLYLWLLVNPGIAGHTRINLTVPLLTTLAFLLLTRITPAPNPTILPSPRRPKRIPPCPQYDETGAAASSC